MQINLDNSIVSALARIFDIIEVAVLFLLCCLPIVTIGAALSAMYTSMIRIAGGNNFRTANHFFSIFKENFKHSTALWLPIFMIGLVVAADIVICWGFEMEATVILAIMRGLTISSSCLYFALLTYLFADIGTFRVSGKQAFTNALQSTMTKIPSSIGMILLWFAIVASIMILWYFAFPVIALCLYLQGKLLYGTFDLESVPFYHDTRSSCF